MRTIRELRLARGWTQGELARRVGVNATSARRWEWGITLPSVPKFRRLAKTFGVRMEDLSLVNEEALEQRALTHKRALKKLVSTDGKTRVA